jgi:hypothetical protein
MGFEFDTFLSDITSSKTVNTLFNNPIWSSLLIAIIILIIIYFIFQGTIDEEYSFWTLWFKAAIYITLTTFSVIFLHYKTVSHEFDRNNEDKLLANTVQSTTGANMTNPSSPPIVVPPAQSPSTVQIIGQGEKPVAISGIFESKPVLATTKDVIFVKS